MPFNYKIKYPIAITLISIGYFLLYKNLNPTAGYTLCLFKKFTSIPCPACGSTRACVSLLNGDILGSLSINPLGLMTSLILFVSCLWMFCDLVRGKESFLPTLKKDWSLTTKFILCFFLTLNWIWNIYKGL